MINIFFLGTLNLLHTSIVLANGQLCKNPLQVTPEDFLFTGLNVAGDTNNSIGFSSRRALIPGLNTLGISVSRIDYAVSGGFVPPHLHPRATEVMTLLEGTLYVGFVSFNQSDNSAKLFTKVLYPGDVFVVPEGLVHFAFNVGEKPVVVLAAFSSQNSGLTNVPIAMFGSKPPISVELLSKAFKLDSKIVEDLLSKF